MPCPFLRTRGRSTLIFFPPIKHVEWCFISPPEAESVSGSVLRYRAMPSSTIVGLHGMTWTWKGKYLGYGEFQASCISDRAVPGCGLTGSFGVDSARASSLRRKNLVNADARAGFLSFFFLSFFRLAHLPWFSSHLYLRDVCCSFAKIWTVEMSCKKSCWHVFALFWNNDANVFTQQDDQMIPQLLTLSLTEFFSILRR